jgi:tRNA 2-selenouridine synthase
MKIEDVYGKEYTFVDVRSPKEFAEDHIPRAVNIPLFDNEERAIVGNMYKQENREAAIEKGLEILSPKLPDMIKEYKKLKPPVIIYCWRGGMRSGSITSLLKSLKFDVERLENGYKDYRRFVREKLETIKIPKLVVLYGLTGSGKTEMLLQVENSIDLEGLAQHRGSILGDIQLEPNSQKRFESLLLKRLFELQNEEFVFTEGESRRIGRIVINESFWKAMQKGTKIKVVCPMEERIERLHKEYCNDLDTILIKKKIGQIVNYLGKKKAKELTVLLDKGNIKKFIEVILLGYYDRLYAHTVDSKKYVATINSIKELKSLNTKEILA